MMTLKYRNPNLKILLGVGGWNHEEKDSPFSYVVQNPGRRTVFIANSISLLRSYG